MTPEKERPTIGDRLKNLETKIESGINKIENQIDDRIGKIGTIGLIVYTMSGLNPIHPDPERANAPAGREATVIEQGPTVVQGRPFNMKPELDTLLDSMLITQRIPPGVPFEQRIGHVDDPRVLDIMREIDDNLGGRIEWPNVYLAEGLRKTTGTLGHHHSPWNREGRSVPHEDNERENRGPYKRFGITLDKELVEHELDTGSPAPDAHISVRSLLAHEIQHATSLDNETNLLNTAAANDWSYEKRGSPTAEGRAGLAQLLDRELSQRQGPGARLNELPTHERRDAIASILTSHLKIDSEDRVTNELHLYMALKDDAYLWSSSNGTWDKGRNESLDRHAHGLDDSPIFVPESSTLPERVTELSTPLETIAERWRNKPVHGSRPGVVAGRSNEATYAENALRRMNDLLKTLTPAPKPAAMENNGKGLNEVLENVAPALKPAADAARGDTTRQKAIPNATAINALRLMRHSRSRTGAAERKEPQAQKTENRAAPSRSCGTTQATGPVRGGGQPAGGTPAPAKTRTPRAVTRA